jgi:hypothetical protein
MTHESHTPAVVGHAEPSVRPGDEARKQMHAAFRELGYTTNGQTSELLDIVFAHVDAEVAAARERCAKLIEPKNPPSDWTPLAQYAADLARRIRTEA